MPILEQRILASEERKGTQTHEGRGVRVAPPPAKTAQEIPRWR